MPQTTMTLLVDGKKVPARAGQTIMEATDEAGVYIPRLCHQSDLNPDGHCRICTVRVNGKPANACTMPAGDGMVIENDTEELNHARRRLLEMLFVEGNHFCPACEASGNCELQALAYRYGMVTPTYPYLYPKNTVDATHKDVFVDRNRCILCGRCVRAAAQLDQKPLLGFVGRGIGTRLAVDAPQFLGDTDLSVSDRAAGICPTGALMIKRVGYKDPFGTRTYDAAPIGSNIEKSVP